ncbi:MAG: hypothetical protein AB1481_01920 [Candidatus Omnitrophota bacterium]
MKKPVLIISGGRKAIFMSVRGPYLLTDFFVYFLLISSIILFIRVGSANSAETITQEERQEAERAFAVLPDARDLPLDNPESPSGMANDELQVLLVKFREGADTLLVLREAGVDTLGVEEINYSLPITDEEEAGNKNKLSKKGEEGWYWFLGDKVKESWKSHGFADFPLHHKVTLAQNLTLAEAVSRLNGNPEIESVMPAYLYKD